MRALLAPALWPLAGCFALAPPDGGGMVDAPVDRDVRAEDIALPDGYRAEVVATGLTFPTGATVDDEGRVYVVEAGYSYGEVFTTPRVLRVEPDGSLAEIAAGGNPPFTGITHHDGALYVAEGGEVGGGRIVRIDPDGGRAALVEDLPSLGDHHTNGPVIGPDGSVYFTVGTATNSAVVGVDNYDYGWLERYPEFHDTPCEDIVLNGINYETPNPLTPEDDVAVTGAYVPFATPTVSGQVIPGELPCSGAVLRVPREGGEIELVAWGLRNPFGIAFSPQGQLYVTENGYDVRGSRPVWGNADWLRRIEPGGWYGWPDYADGRVVSEPRYAAPGEEPLALLLAEVPSAPPTPESFFAVHGGVTGMAFAPNDAWGSPQTAYVALFGDMAPAVGKVVDPAGFRVVRVDVGTGEITEFASNAGKKVGPATWMGTGGLERPTDVAFSPDGLTLYVVDFGIMTMTETGEPVPRPETGVLWKITAERAPIAEAN